MKRLALLMWASVAAAAEFPPPPPASMLPRESVVQTLPYEIRQTELASLMPKAVAFCHLDHPETEYGAWKGTWEAGDFGRMKEMHYCSGTNQSGMRRLYRDSEGRTYWMEQLLKPDIRMGPHMGEYVEQAYRINGKEVHFTLQTCCAGVRLWSVAWESPTMYYLLLIDPVSANPQADIDRILKLAETLP